MLDTVHRFDSLKGFVLITGAAKRLGRAIALQAARCGWDVVVHYNGSADEADELVAAIQELGRNAFSYRADLTDPKAITSFIPSIIGRVEGHDASLRGVVNNASLFLPDDEDPKGQLLRAIHVLAPVTLTEDLFRFLPKSETASVVNMLDGTPSPPSFSHYAASKKTLRTATHEMAKTYAPSMRVNGVEPGPTLKSPNESDSHFQAMIDKTLLKKASGVDDIAAAVCFLLDNGSITDETLRVNCGMGA